MATTSMLMFRNRDCLSLFVSSNTTLLELQTLLFLFFPKSAFPNWGWGLSKDAAYTRTFTVNQSKTQSLIILNVIHA